MAHVEKVLVTSAARTATGDSGEISDPNTLEGDAAAAALILDITAVSGTTPSMTTIVEAKDPASGKWFQVATFGAKTAVGTTVVWVGVGSDAVFLPNRLRVSWTITGASPSFTFTVGLTGRN